jgi:hypothetical protein
VNYSRLVEEYQNITLRAIFVRWSLVVRWDVRSVSGQVYSQSFG